MRGQLHAQSLYPRRDPGTHLIESWVSLRGGLEILENRKSNPDSHNQWPFTATTTLFRHHHGYIAEMWRRLLLISTNIAFRHFLLLSEPPRKRWFHTQCEDPTGTALIEVPKLMFMKTGNRHGAIS